MIYINRRAYGTTVRIEVRGEADTPDCWRELYDAVASNLPSYQTLELDLGGLEKAKINCGAVLLRGIAMAKRSRKKITVTSLSKTLSDAIDVAGMRALVEPYIQEGGPGDQI